GAVTPAKLSKGAKATLQGPPGPQGTQGPVGKEGAEGKEGPRGQEGPQGPGAVTIEQQADSSIQTVGTFSGIKVIDSCTGGNAFLQLQNTVGSNSMTEFGTVTQGTTVVARQAD